MSKLRNIDEKSVIEAIHESGAIILTIANRLHCSWSTARKAVDQWDETKQAFEAEKERTLDQAETAIHDAIKKGDLDACKWYLAKKGRTRGYGDSMQLTGEDSGPLEFVIAKEDSGASFLNDVIQKS